MKLLQKYITQQIIPSILLVLLVLVGLDVLFTLLYELKFVGKGDYSFSVCLQFILLTLPRRLYFIFPWASLLGTLLALSRLAASNELIVLRTSGLSIIEIGKIVLRSSLFLIIFLVFLGEGVAPFSEQMADDKKTIALSGGSAIYTAYGIWVKSEHEFIHVRKVYSEKRLAGVTCYRFAQDRTLLSIIQADTADWDQGRWVLKKVRKTDFNGNKVLAVQKDFLVYNTLPDLEILQTSMAIRLERLSLNNLWKSIQYHKQNDTDVRTYKLTFWAKIFQPFFIVLITFLTIPFIFGPLRTVTIGFRMVVGILAGFCFYLLNSFLPLIAVYKLSPFLSAVLPLLVLVGIGYYLLRRMR